MSYGTVQAEKMTTESGYSLGAGNASSFKNRLINGGMVIDQRNAGASATIGPSTSTDYRVDRFFFQRFGGTATFTGSQSTAAPAGFTNSLSATVAIAAAPAAGDTTFIRQLIEGFNVADLGFGAAGAQSVTVSFWVNSSITGTYGGSVTNGAFDRSYVFTYSINSANTWEQKTITVPGDTTGTWLKNSSAGMRLNLDLGSGSNMNGTANTWTSSTTMRTSGCVNWIANSGATFYLTGVQLEVGTVATSFDFRSYGTELALCQRYYQRTDTGQGVLFGVITTQTGAEYHYRYLQEMRAAPTLSYSSVSNFTCYAWSLGAGRTPSTIASLFPTTRKLVVALSFASSVAVENVGKAIAIDGNSSDFLSFSSEL